MMLCGSVDRFGQRLSPAPRDPLGWLFKAVRFKAINLSRSSDDAIGMSAQPPAATRQTGLNEIPFDAVQSHELEAMLTELEPINREIIVARIWGGMSFEQIAELVECSISTIHRRYQQTLKQLEMKLKVPSRNAIREQTHERAL